MTTYDYYLKDTPELGYSHDEMEEQFREYLDSVEPWPVVYGVSLRPSECLDTDGSFYEKLNNWINEQYDCEILISDWGREQLAKECLASWFMDYFGELYMNTTSEQTRLIEAELFKLWVDGTLIITDWDSGFNPTVEFKHDDIVPVILAIASAVEGTGYQNA